MLDGQALHASGGAAAAATGGRWCPTDEAKLVIMLAQAIRSCKPAVRPLWQRGGIGICASPGSPAALLAAAGGRRRRASARHRRRWAITHTLTLPSCNSEEWQPWCKGPQQSLASTRLPRSPAHLRRIGCSKTDPQLRQASARSLAEAGQRLLRRSRPPLLRHRTSSAASTCRTSTPPSPL